MKNNIGKKIAFFTIVPLLVILSNVSIECPVCHGTGTVKDNNNMENIRVVSIDKRITDSVQDMCSGYIVTKALPVISIQNLGESDADGYLKITLVDLNKNVDLCSQYIKISVPGEATTSMELNMVFAFYSADVPSDYLTIKAEPVTDEVEDLVCDGTGKIKANEYFLVDKLKEELTSVVQNVQEFSPDLSHGEPGSPEWLAFYELE